jgi:hypothetical protein
MKRSFNSTIIDKICNLLPIEILSTAASTPLGLLYWPNEDRKIGAEYLVKLNFPIASDATEWQTIDRYFNGGNEQLCKKFFAECNGFSLGRRFTAFGILQHDAHRHGGNSYLNVPYDLQGQSFGSYPQFAPSAGYFLSQARIGPDERLFCNVIEPDGAIISGEFRENERVAEVFGSFEHWLDRRVPTALREIRNDLESRGER